MAVLKKATTQTLQYVKKLATVLATSTLMTANKKASAKTPTALQGVSCIWYPIKFQENQEIKNLIYFSSKVNAIISAYTTKLNLSNQKTSLENQKIDSSPLETYKLVLAKFLIQDSLRKVRFFKKTFLLKNISIKMVLRMSFLSLSNVDVKFVEKSKILTQRFYIAIEALPTTSRVELIDKGEFAKAVLDENSKTFIVYVSALKATESLNPSWPGQIPALQWDKTLNKVLAKYSNYTDIFSFNLAIELHENTRINEHIIELLEDKLPLCDSIYAFNLVELETLKFYIKNHLKTGFIKPFKSFVGAFIFFDKKINRSFCLCINY